MAEQYRQLTFLERQRIEEGLTAGSSFREIARLLGRSAATVSREVRTNRSPRAQKTRRAACRDRNWCKRVEVCASCVRRGVFCSECDARDCRDACTGYAAQTACDILSRAPWVCNACKKARYGCSRANRWVYSAKVADEMAKERRSDSRRGIDMDKERADRALGIIKDAVARGLSPYEISVSYAEAIGVSPSTVYRWVEAGYGGLANIELERKVGFKPRSHAPAPKSTSHTPKRSHARFLELAEEVRASALEMDCVEGLATDRRAVLTLYSRASHLQLALLLEAKDCEHVKERLRALRSVCDPGLYGQLARAVLTDNGSEFADEDGIGSLFGENLAKGEPVRLFYCDPRQSQQKGACEKNHSELRQILAKGGFSFNLLTPADLSVLMSHANSNPRASLCGLSPIRMFKAAYGQAGIDLLDGLGVREVGPDELTLKPDILDIERKKRGEDPLLPRS